MSIEYKFCLFPFAITLTIKCTITQQRDSHFSVIIFVALKLKFFTVANGKPSQGVCKFNFHCVCERYFKQSEKGMGQVSFRFDKMKQFCVCFFNSRPVNITHDMF